jgi:inhibitor of KinA
LITWHYLGLNNIEVCFTASNNILFSALIKDYLEKERFSGVSEIVAYPSSIFIEFDSFTTPIYKVIQYISSLTIELKEPSRDRAVLKSIPVCYDDDFGIDRDVLSEKLGLSFPEIVQIHSSSEYHLDMYGFVPGFMYLSGLDPLLTIPRKSTPSVKVPAGSVAIAHQYSGIYPANLPGGWYILGRTPIKLMDIAQPRVFPYQPGERIKFRKITLQEFIEWEK